jgi:hypothetical protein
MVAWVKRQKKFFPNWEVAKIVEIPFAELLNPANYRRYRLRMDTRRDAARSESFQDMPCFQFDADGHRELLWGATYRITTVFLDYVFGFKAPVSEELPVTEGTLNENYLTGQK